MLSLASMCLDSGTLREGIDGHVGSSCRSFVSGGAGRFPGFTEFRFEFLLASLSLPVLAYGGIDKVEYVCIPLVDG